MSYDSKIEVTLKVVIDVDTNKNPKASGCTPASCKDEELKNAITDVLADQISQYNDEDLTAAITGWKILKTKRESV